MKNPDSKGFYGEFGGAFIPELLHPNVTELQQQYLTILKDPTFVDELKILLNDYVGRPTPLYFASRLSAKYQTSVYLKREDLCHTGAHKINNTLGQLLMAKRLGKRHIIAETGAGQHGVATATACALMGYSCTIYMGEVDVQRQAPNVLRMKMLGAKVIPVTSGSRTLKDATNEAIRHWINHPTDNHYIIGSVVGPHPYPDLVSRLQAVISEEIKQQIEGVPTAVIACVGGGSNAMGAFYHFIDDASVSLIGVEAAGHGIATQQTAATISVGRPGVLHASMTYLMQNADGQILEPHSISAGLDYPGIGPAHAHFHCNGRVKYAAVTDDQAIQAGLELAKLEGIIPAIESAHALAYLTQGAFSKEDKIVVNLSGRGDKDLGTYKTYFNHE